MKPKLHTRINSIILHDKKSSLLIGSQNLNTTIGAYIRQSLVRCSKSDLSEDFSELRNRFDLFMRSDLKLKSFTKTTTSTGLEVVLNWYVYEDSQYMFQVVEIQD